MYRIEIITDMSRCFCLTKPRTGLPQYFHFSKFREHQQSETALWRRLFLLVLVFNIYPTKVLVRIALHLLLGLCSLEMMLRRLKQFSSKTAHACTYRKATTTTQVLQSSQESPIGQNDDGNLDRWLYHQCNWTILQIYILRIL